MFQDEHVQSKMKKENKHMKSGLSGEPVGIAREWWVALGLAILMIQGACSSTDMNGMAETDGAGGIGSGHGVPPAVDGDDSRNWGSLEEAAAFATPPPPVNVLACSTGADCTSGFCVDGVCCDNACAGTCQACTAAKKGSGPDGTCGMILLYGDPDHECASGSCDGAGACKMYNGNSCTGANDCLSGYCVDGFCCGNACAETCRACSVEKRGGGYNGQCGPIAAGTDPDGECSGGSCNGSAACQMLGVGNACSMNSECSTGFCVDGFCCDTACSNTCEACSAVKKGSGSDGTCGAIAVNNDPDYECTNGKCNGSGGCFRYNGATCTTADECMSTYCVDGFCCGNACAGTCISCSAAKKGGGYDGQCGFIASSTDPDDECTPGECNGTGTCTQGQVLQANGTACTNGSQCTSGNCTDGVCCDMACTGTCEACTVAKKGSGTDGTCGAIKYDFDPDNECANGSCSGTGTCQFYNGVACASTAECLSNNCVDGFCCGNACTGPCQACSAAKKGSGLNGVCGVIAANTDPDNECGGMCNGSGACQPQANGNACSSAAECTSGHCVDGYCCNSACTGTCMSCNNAGFLGSCTPGCTPACSGTIGFPNAPLTPLPVVGGDLFATAIGDFDANGVPDVVVADYGASKVRVLLNQGGGNLGTNVDYVTGWNPSEVKVKDLNGDGKVDIVTANYAADTVSVFLNNGNGTFAAKVDYPTGPEPRSVTCADVNGDGWMDLVTANSLALTATHDAVSVLLNQGNGTFAPRVDYGDWSTGTRSVTTADMNGDGKPDIISLTSHFVRVMMNNGNGTFGAPAAWYQEFTGLKCTTGDFNGDGKPDVAVGNQYNAGVNVYINTGNGALAAPVNYGGPEQRNIVAADVNQDGKLDLVTSISGSAACVRLNLGNGTFGGVTQYPTREENRDVAVADMTGDGKNDIVAAGMTTVMVMPNHGNGVFFTGSGNYTTLPGSVRATTADFNGDGKPDVAVTSSGLPGKVSVMLNHGAGTLGTRADYTVGSQPRTLAAADFTGDGKPDLAVLNHSSKTMSVLRNLGNGTFATKYDYVLPDYPLSVAAADFTNEGRIDLAVFSFKASYDFSQGPANPIPSNNVFSMFVNNGTGNFNALPTSTLYTRFNSPAGAGYDALAARDFTGDGTVDIAIVLSDLQAVRIWIGQANGTFVSLNSYPFTGPRGVALGDIDGDGKADLIVSTYNNGITVMRNLGAGNFGSAVTYPIAVGEMALGDINGDGKLDLALTQSNNSIAVVLNQGNGTLGSPTIYASGAAAPASISIADMNADEKNDLVVLNSGSNIVSILQNTCL